MGKKGRKKKKAKAKKTNGSAQEPSGSGSFPGLFSQGNAEEHMAESAFFDQYVERMRASEDSENQAYARAIELLQDAIELVQSGGDASVAASLCANAWLTHYKGWQDYVRIKDAGQGILRETILKMAAAENPDRSLSYAVISYATSMLGGGLLSPAESLAILDRISELVGVVAKMKNVSLDQDLASVLMQKSIFYMMLGRPTNAMKCLRKAAKIGRGNHVGDATMFQLLCITQMSAPNFEHDLRYLLDRANKDSRDYPSLLARLIMYLHSPSGAAKAARNPSGHRYEIRQLRDQYIVARKHSCDFHGPFALYKPGVLDENEKLLHHYFALDDAGFDMFSAKANAAALARVNESKRENEGKSKTKAACSVDDTCLNCGKTAGTSKLLKCGGCSVVQYCSRVCQKEHWKAHKKNCKRLDKTKKPSSVSSFKPTSSNSANAPRFSQRPMTAQDAMNETYRLGVTLIDILSKFRVWWGGASLHERKKLIRGALDDIPEDYVGARGAGDNLFPDVSLRAYSGNNCCCVGTGAGCGQSYLICTMGHAVMTRDACFKQHQTFASECVFSGLLPRRRPDWFVCAADKNMPLSDENVHFYQINRKFPEKAREFESMIAEEARNRTFHIMSADAFDYACLRETTILKFMVRITDLYKEKILGMETQNSDVKAFGCTVCRKDATLVCNICKMQFWCSKSCKNKDIASHHTQCPGRESCAQFLRANFVDRRPSLYGF